MQVAESVNISDSTKLKCLMQCPRRYYYEYFLSWRPIRTNVHLVFGTAWHLGLAYLMEIIQDGRKMQPEDADVAFAIFLEEYRESFKPANDFENKAKIPVNAQRAFKQYIKQYSNTDQFEVIDIEVAGSAPISDLKPERKVYFKLDAVCLDNQGSFVLEHKTASFFGHTFYEMWQQNMQINTYYHALVCYFGSVSKVKGVMINATAITNEPKLKKDGEPYAGAKDTEFMRLMISKTTDHLESWLFDINCLFDDLERYVDQYTSCSDRDTIMKAFPRHTEHCVHKFGTCPYTDFCEAWHNPIQNLHRIPVGFQVDVWDPRDVVKEARTVVGE